MRNELLEAIGISLQGFLGAFFGGLLLMQKTPRRKRIAKATVFGCGCFVGGMVAPFITDTLGLHYRNADALFGFIIGYGGIELLDFGMQKYVYKNIEEKGGSDDKSN